MRILPMYIYVLLQTKQARQGTQVTTRIKLIIFSIKIRGSHHISFLFDLSFLETLFVKCSETL